MNDAVDDTYTLVDLTDTEVNFGDVLIGRINYYVSVGVLLKIKTNPKTYYACCVNSAGHNINFDISVNHKTKIARIDAYSNEALNAFKNDFAISNTITPLFESYRPTVGERKLSPEAGIKKLAKRVNEHVLYCRTRHYEYGQRIDFSFNKKPYTFYINCYNNKWEFSTAYSTYIESVDVTTHPDIMAALEGKYAE